MNVKHGKCSITGVNTNKYHFSLTKSPIYGLGSNVKNLRRA